MKGVSGGGNFARCAMVHRIRSHPPHKNADIRDVVMAATARDASDIDTAVGLVEGRVDVFGSAPPMHVQQRISGPQMLHILRGVELTEVLDNVCGPAGNVLRE